MSCKIKICGITNREDLEMVARHGADFGGVLVDMPVSPRTNRLENAAALAENPPLPVVVLTLNKDADDIVRTAERIGPFAMQLQGDEPPETVATVRKRLLCEIWKVIHLPFSETGETVDTERVLREIAEYKDAGADKFLFDASGIVGGKKRYGGTGKVVDWKTIGLMRERIDAPFLLAGGLSPENVAEAVRAVQPWGIDLSSGVEIEIGKKNPALVALLIENTRTAE